MFTVGQTVRSLDNVLGATSNKVGVITDVEEGGFIVAWPDGEESEYFFDDEIEAVETAAA